MVPVFHVLVGHKAPELHKHQLAFRSHDNKRLHEIIPDPQSPKNDYGEGAWRQQRENNPPERGHRAAAVYGRRLFEFFRDGTYETAVDENAQRETPGNIVKE